MLESELPIVAKRLREARLHLGLSQKALGVAAGINEDSASPRINQYERGKHTPDFLTLTHLATVLRVPVPYFYTEDEELAELLTLLHTTPRPLWSKVKTYLTTGLALE